MKQIFVHGLGQTSSSWKAVLAELDGLDHNICLNLPDLVQGKEVDYNNLYKAFVSECNRYNERLDLCGLSLGGVLCLNYAIDYPQKVHSLILIATQYKMPKRLLQLQNMLFHFMPSSSFEQMGFGKKDFIQLCKTMAELDFSKSLSKVSCRTLVVCGEKDFANRKASDELANVLANAKIHIMKGAGHEINIEVPKSLGKELQDFWRE